MTFLKPKLQQWGSGATLVVLIFVGSCSAQVFGNIGLVDGHMVENPSIFDRESISSVTGLPDRGRVRGESNLTGDIDFSCKQGGATTSYCYRACVLGASQARCGGDSLYCSIHKCIGNPECICDAVQIAVSVLSQLERLPYQLVPSNVTFMSQPPPEAVADLRERRSQSARAIDPSDYATNINLDHRELTLVVSPPGNYEVDLRKRKFFKQWFFDDSWSGELPDELWDASDYLIVDIKVNGTLIDTEVFYILAESRCTLTDCFFCRQTFDSWSCFTWTQKVVVIAILSASFLIIIAFFPALVWIVYWLMSSIWGVIWFFCKATWFFTKTPMGKSWQAMKDKVSRTRDGLVPEEMPVDEPVYRPEPVPQPPMARRGGSTIRKLAWTGLAIMCLAGSCSAVCTDGIFLSGSFSNCVKTSATKEQCSFVSQTLISLSDVGASVCFSILDPNKNTTVQSGVLNFTSERLTAGTEFLYTTGKWGLQYYNNKKCAERSSCPSECDPTYSSKSVPGPIANNAPSSIVLWPGEATCYKSGESCPLFGGDCNSCDDACIFSAYAIVPDLTSQTNYGNVYDFTQISRKPTVTWSSGANVYTLDVGITTTVGYLKITPQGSLSQQPTDFGTKKLIVSNAANVWLGSAAEPNAPVAQGVGDIQAISFSKFSTPAENAFLYASNIVSEDKRTNQIIYTAARTGWSALSSYPKLPTVVAGNTWTYSNGVFSSLVSSTAPLLVTVSTDASFTVVRTLEAVCPTITLKKASGCADCFLGISFVFQAKSKCLSGLATVTFKPDTAVEISTKSVLLDTDVKNFTVNAFTSLKRVVGSICLTGTGGQACASVDFKTTTSSPVDPNDPPANTTSFRNSTDNFKWSGLFSNFAKYFPKFFSDIFSGKATAVMITVFTLGILTSLTVSGVMIYYFWPYGVKAIALAYPPINSLLPTKLKVS